MTGPDRPRRLQRFRAPHGRRLTIANIHGPWRPDSVIGGTRVFAVIWSTPMRYFWAPLHDFEPACQLRLIEACRAQFERPCVAPGGWVEAFPG